MTESATSKEALADTRPDAAGSASDPASEDTISAASSASLPPTDAPSSPVTDTNDAAGATLEVVGTDWDYRVEGGQHLVFTYTGSDASLRNKILRMRSVKLSASPAPQPSFPLCDEAAAEEALLASPVGPFVPASTRLTVPGLTAHLLGERALPGRPKRRVNHNGVPALPAPALVQDDLARLFGRATCAVEVKPKGMHASRSRLIPPDEAAALQKYTRCDAHTKYDKSFPCDRPNPYNPADLLSGSAARAATALEALRAPSSRWLRVLHAGGVFLAAPARASNLGGRAKVDAYSDPATRRLLTLAADALGAIPDAPKAVADMQALDAVDRYGAAALWAHLAESEGPERAATRVWDAYLDPRLLPGRPDSFANEAEHALWSSRVSYPTPAVGRRTHGPAAFASAQNAIRSMPMNVAARLLAGFMLAAAARDCSMLVSLARDDEAESHPGMGTVTDADGVLWRFAVHVIDLGPKPLCKLEPWAHQQEEASVDARMRQQTPRGRK